MQEHAPRRHCAHAHKSARSEALDLAVATGCGANGKGYTMTHSPEPRASRVPPPRVPPVFIVGMRYAQVSGDLETDGQAGGILAAYDASNHEAWRLKVYENPRRSELEGDVQDVWFRSMREANGKLLIENERGKWFEVDPETRHVYVHPAPVPDSRPGIDPIPGQPRILRPGDKCRRKMSRASFPHTLPTWLRTARSLAKERDALQVKLLAKCKEASNSSGSDSELLIRMTEEIQAYSSGIELLERILLSRKSTRKIRREIASLPQGTARIVLEIEMMRRSNRASPLYLKIGAAVVYAMLIAIAITLYRIGNPA